ncbi:electron transfer flavoprotein subunit beta/FixA family protein [Ferroacidibacillus organovorans]|uniref:Electron transfer flavoprotein subunit beta n=1 Tax=Ferroacidibacillus organovorans TaxID=1765683 RepID=A0A1V4EWT9_9BACL|nr:electron transfer flavoprotein subunit beta/FixA family protein [Ferroacidibacillus organovorans]OPG17361.1 hypothetical protein B2M26_01080 [Ferroacidibacillus organovorans]
MNILVMMKVTFSTEEEITIEQGEIVQEGISLILNPYDEYALEQAVQVKEVYGGEVTVLSVGPKRYEDTLRTALAMGADRMVLIDDPALMGDEWIVSQAISAFAKKERFDLIFGGQMSIDYASAQMGPRVAVELGIPIVTTILEFTMDGQCAVVHRDMDGYMEKLRVPLPALFTTQQGLNEPRYPTLQNRMRARKKPIVYYIGEDLDFSHEDRQVKTVSQEFFVAPRRSEGKILHGSLADQVKELCDFLRFAIQ